MKNTFFLFIALISITYSAFAQVSVPSRYDTIAAKFSEISNNAPGLDDYVDITLTNSSLQAFLAGMGNAHRLNIIVEPDVDPVVSLNFTNEKVRDVLLFVCQKYDLDIRFTGAIMSFYKVKHELIAAPKRNSVILNTDSSVSTEDQAQGDAPETHERRARLYAEAKEWHVAKVYHLEAVSGKSVMEHPEAKRMLNDVRKGTITGLIFSKLARLARNTKELLEFADYFRDHDADLVSISEAIDTSTPAGRLFYTMIAAMAQWEREEIASRIAASVPIRARMGKQLAGEATFGYRWENQILVIDENEAPVRKHIYKLFLKHKRKKTVAHEMNRMGYRTRGGGEFTDTSVKRLLKNSTAKGVHLANYTTMRNGLWEIKPESEWVFTPCPAIVSAEVWDECNRILDEQTKKRPPVPKSSACCQSAARTSCTAPRSPMR